jgi:hypothetical protein
MKNNELNHLIPEISKQLTQSFLNILATYKEFKGFVDTSPFLNMTTSVFISSLINMLDTIKKSTEGEEKLIQNIELTISTLTKAIQDLPFVERVDFV